MPMKLVKFTESSSLALFSCQVKLAQRRNQVGLEPAQRIKEECAASTTTETCALGRVGTGMSPFDRIEALVWLSCLLSVPYM